MSEKEMELSILLTLIIVFSGLAWFCFQQPGVRVIISRLPVEEGR